MNLFVRWDGAFGGKDYSEVSLCWVCWQPAADWEEEALRCVEKRRPVLQHWRFASLWPPKLCVLSGSSWWHFQASCDLWLCLWFIHHKLSSFQTHQDIFSDFCLNVEPISELCGGMLQVFHLTYFGFFAYLLSQMERRERRHIRGSRRSHNGSMHIGGKCLWC